jgi:hypothetical protein
LDISKGLCLDQVSGNKLEEENGSNIGSNEFGEIKAILRQFQDGYILRDLKKVNSFVEELFVESKDTFVIGTGMSELYLGSEEVKELIEDDWEEWGDVKIDYENAHISIYGEVAWFATKGSVKYNFEDTPESHERHIDFIKSNIEDVNLTSKQKIAFINWALALMYHQREGDKREYFWPMNLSGVLLKGGGKWKFIHLKFSMTRSNFPDERLENSQKHLENYNKFNKMIDRYKNNNIPEKLKCFLGNLETELIGKKGISKELVSRYFAHESNPYVIGLDNQWYNGLERVREFFYSYSDSAISLDFDNAIVSNSGDVHWVTITGMLRKEMAESDIADSTIEEINTLFQSSRTPSEILFLAHRSVSYSIKESAAGNSYTWPIRITAIILDKDSDFYFHNIHFSFPFYWIIEGKIYNDLCVNMRRIN